MHRIDGAGNVDGMFVHEDAQAMRPPTEITDRWLNSVQEELVGVIEGLNVPLNPADNRQLITTLLGNFIQKSSAPHFIRNVYQIVPDRNALDALQNAPSGAEVIVTDNNGQGFGLAYNASGTWNVQPLTVNAFDLYGTLEDNHGYYWFGRAWKIYDIESLSVPNASEIEHGTVRIATLAEALAGVLFDCVVTPAHVAAYVDKIFVGQLAWFSCTTAPNGWVVANGGLLSREQYARLWGFAQSSGNLVADAAWTSATGSYSTGDGVSNFRVPDLRGEFLRGWDNGRGVDSGRKIGSMQGDAMRNITGSFEVSDSDSDGKPQVGAAQGAFSITSGTGAVTKNDGTTSGTRSSSLVRFNVSSFLGSYVANEFRPRSVAELLCIKT
jgi:microcystin-dependent protein